MVEILLFADFIILLILTVCFFIALYIIKNYKIGSFSELQYDLEQKSYLLSTLIHFSIYLYIILSLFYIYILDDLSLVVVGAMCGAGVVSSNIYGNYLIALKFFVIIFSLLYIAIHHEDMKTRDSRYFKKKIFFFLFLFILNFLSFVIEILFFQNINQDDVVSCCSTIYKQTDSYLDDRYIAILFYINIIFILFFTFYKKRVYVFILSLFFVYISYLSITYFFSPYIYELPTHKCPYCLLASDYYYVGYFIYATLILSVYYSLYGAIFNFKDNLKLKIYLSYTIFVLFLSYKLYF